MQNFIEVLKPAADLSLITLYEAKNALALTDDKNDDLLSFIITRASDEVAKYCNRTFAQETVAETILEVVDSGKILLERYPIKEIISVVSNGVEVFPEDYLLDKITGKMLGDFSFPLTVTYTGGYDLPFESPPALRQAIVLAAREAYFAALRGDATVRMVGHKESRVIYFDPNASLKAVSGSGSGGGGSAATRSMKALLERFTRWEV